ncbi:aldehyde dehydrogenase family protein, partial [Pseudomonas avellanae]|uniref:aldehyde dehydrogenase family protein n=4 Tax=Pseudomonas avellanae TaxID=46257 RepID=UPI001E564B1C
HISGTPVGFLDAGLEENNALQLADDVMLVAQLVDHIGHQVDDAVNLGATLVIGGQLQGSILQPTLLDGVTDRMRLYREESFGPVAVVIRGEGDEALLALANDSEFGLSAAIFSRDTGRALALAQRVESGICHINGPTVHDEAQMPFGGVKSSGYGSFGGKASIEHFTQLRWVTLQNGPRHYPI